MKIGISRPSQTPQSGLEVLQLAREFGFEGVQLKPAQYGDFLSAPQNFASFYGSLSNLSRGGLIFYPSQNPQTWAAQIEPVFLLAAQIGAGHICICCGVGASGASDAQVTEVAEVLGQIGVRARALGLVISIHNHMDSLVETESDIARLLEKLDPQMCGLTLDTAHAAKAGIASVSALVSRFGPHLLNVHLKDLAADGQFCGLGQDELGMRPIFRALEAMDYDQWLIVDEETAALSSREAFGIARDFLRREGVLENNA